MRLPKKLIATGWDKPDTERLRQNLQQMEQRPFDGVVFEAVGRLPDQKPKPLRFAFVNEKWKREWFQHCIDDLRACAFKKFTDNFLLVNASPGGVDWFDDAGWENVVDHWRIAAWIAKESGIKGILFDPEAYSLPQAQFSYRAQPGRDKHTFEEYYVKARERGRRVMQVIADECPHLTLFCYFMNIVNANATGRADPKIMLSGNLYGLYAPFVDGWLDVIPPTITLVDGCECAYLYNSVQQFAESAVLIKGACMELVSPENRVKYRAQVQVGFGIYLDAYWNPKDSKWGMWYIDGLGGARVNRLRANVSTALRMADEYVWIYGEKFRWWPTPNKAVNAQTWPEALPGCEAALRYARHPVEYARTQIGELKKAGRCTNLLHNGDFGSDMAPATGVAQTQEKKDKPLEGWSFWQAKTSKGNFMWDREVGAAAKGSARMSNVTYGCLYQSHDVKPGERYAVQAMRKLQGRGDARIRGRWQTSESKWTLEAHDKMILCEGPRDKWAEMFDVIEIPEGVDKLVIMLMVSDQASPEDVVWYDDVGLYRIE